MVIAGNKILISLAETCNVLTLSNKFHPTTREKRIAGTEGYSGVAACFAQLVSGKMIRPH
jgi:hypothetical protein